MKRKTFLNFNRVSFDRTYEHTIKDLCKYKYMCFYTFIHPFSKDNGSQKKQIPSDMKEVRDLHFSSE